MDNLKLCFVFALVLLSSVQSSEICDYQDTGCLTRAAKNALNNLLAGVKDVVEPINMLSVEHISGRIPGFKYALNNATLSPMSSCIPELKYVGGYNNYEYTLRCSQLTLNAVVVAKGRLGPIDVDGSDSVTITADNYVMIVKGEQVIKTQESDQTQHIYLTKENITVDTDVQGSMSFTTNNMFGLTKEQGILAENYFKENWRMLENTFRFPTITEFMSELLFKKFDPYLRATRLDAVLPKYEQI